MPTDEPAILTERQVARWLGLGEATVYRLRHEGTGPAFIRLSARRVGYRRSAIEAWLKARERDRVSDADDLVRDPAIQTPYSPNIAVAYSAISRWRA
jgi:predicted DNA-binding transcriptional regulator AlpA